MTIRAELAALRVVSAEAAEVEMVLREIEQAVGRALPVPTLIWPKAPLGDPELVEPA